MSSTWSKEVTWTQFGQLWDPDRKWMGRLHYHHTSDTVIWDAETVDDLPKEHRHIGFFNEEWDAILEALDSLKDA